MSLLSLLGRGVHGVENAVSHAIHPQQQQGQQAQPIAPHLQQQQVPQGSGGYINPQGQAQWNPSMGGAPQPHPLQQAQPSLQEMGTIDNINNATGSPYGDFTVGVPLNEYNGDGTNVGNINQATGFGRNPALRNLFNRY